MVAKKAARTVEMRASTPAGTSDRSTVAPMVEYLVVMMVETMVASRVASMAAY